jgi:hypothetical protein
MTQNTDPVGSGFVASIAHPGRNITGLSILSPKISGKQPELLKEIVPRLSRMAVLGTSTNPGNPQAVKETELAATVFGVQHLYLDIAVPRILRELEPGWLFLREGRRAFYLSASCPRMRRPAGTEVGQDLETQRPIRCLIIQNRSDKTFFVHFSTNCGLRTAADRQSLVFSAALMLFLTASRISSWRSIY